MRTRVMWLSVMALMWACSDEPDPVPTCGWTVSPERATLMMGQTATIDFTNTDVTSLDDATLTLPSFATQEELSLVEPGHVRVVVGCQSAGTGTVFLYQDACGQEAEISCVVEGGTPTACLPSGTYQGTLVYRIDDNSCDQTSYTQSGGIVVNDNEITIYVEGTPVLDTTLDADCVAQGTTSDNDTYSVTCQDNRCAGTVTNINTSGCEAVFDFSVDLEPSDRAFELQELECGTEALQGVVNGDIIGIERLGDSHLAVLTERRLFIVDRETAQTVGEVRLPSEVSEAPALSWYGEIGEGPLVITPQGRQDGATPIAEVDFSDVMSPTIELIQVEGGQSAGSRRFLQSVDGSSAYLVDGDTTATNVIPVAPELTFGTPVELAFGSPHVATFDGSAITFAGWGDFNLIQTVDPTSGEVIQSAELETNIPFTVAAQQGNLLFVGGGDAASSEGLLLTLSPDTPPVVVSSITREGGPMKDAFFYGDGELALLMGGNSRGLFTTLDVSNPSAPRQLGGFRFPGDPQSIGQLADRTFLVGSEVRLFYVDMSSCP